MKRVSKDPLSGAKLGLLSAAGALIAERGMDAVSLREITEKAQANVAAVNYHFGSREGLLQSLMEMVLLPLWQERLVRMEAAELKWGRKAVPLEELVDLWVRSVVGLVKRSALGEEIAMGVTGRAIRRPRGEWPAEVRLIADSLVVRWEKSLQRVLVGVKPEEWKWRVQWLDGALSAMLLGGGEVWKIKDMELVCSAFVRFGIAGLRAGVNEEVGADAPAVRSKGGQETFDF